MKWNKTKLCMWNVEIMSAKCVSRCDVILMKLSALCIIVITPKISPECWGAVGKFEANDASAAGVNGPVHVFVAYYHLHQRSIMCPSSEY